MENQSTDRDQSRSAWWWAAVPAVPLLYFMVVVPILARFLVPDSRFWEAFFTPAIWLYDNFAPYEHFIDWAID